MALNGPIVPAVALVKRKVTHPAWQTTAKGLTGFVLLPTLWATESTITYRRFGGRAALAVAAAGPIGGMAWIAWRARWLRWRRTAASIEWFRRPDAALARGAREPRARGRRGDATGRRARGRARAGRRLTRRRHIWLSARKTSYAGFCRVVAAQQPEVVVPVPHVRAVVAHLEPEQRARERAPVLRPAQDVLRGVAAPASPRSPTCPLLAVQPPTSAPVGAPVSVPQICFAPSPLTAMIQCSVSVWWKAFHALR